MIDLNVSTRRIEVAIEARGEANAGHPNATATETRIDAAIVVLTLVTADP